MHRVGCQGHHESLAISCSARGRRGHLGRPARGRHVGRRPGNRSGRRSGRRTGQGQNLGHRGNARRRLHQRTELNQAVRPQQGAARRLERKRRRDHQRRPVARPVRHRAHVDDVAGAVQQRTGHGGSVGRDKVAPDGQNDVGAGLEDLGRAGAALGGRHAHRAPRVAVGGQRADHGAGLGRQGRDGLSQGPRLAVPALGRDDDGRVLAGGELLFPPGQAARLGRQTFGAARTDGGERGGRRSVNQDRLELGGGELRRGRVRPGNDQPRYPWMGVARGVNPVRRHRLGSKDVADEQHRVGLGQRLRTDQLRPAAVQTVHQARVAGRDARRPAGAHVAGEPSDGRQRVDVQVPVGDDDRRAGDAQRLGHAAGGVLDGQGPADPLAVAGAAGLPEPVRMVEPLHQHAPAPAQAHVAGVRHVVGHVLVRPDAQGADRASHAAQQAAGGGGFGRGRALRGRHSGSP